MNKTPIVIFIAVLFSFFVAFVLSLIPVSAEYVWLKPSWTLLVLIYWVLFVGSRVGVLTGFSVGLLMDIIDDLTLGTMALTLSIAAFVEGLFRNKFRTSGVWQHIAIVFFIVSLANLLKMWLKMLLSNLPENYSFWVTTLVTIAVWPFVLALLKSYQKLTIPNPR